jgi:predicted small metal-binding protein
MERLLRCGDLMPGCPAEVRATTDDEIMHQATEHARTAHGLEEIDAATAQAVRAAIHDAD